MGLTTREYSDIQILIVWLVGRCSVQVTREAVRVLISILVTTTALAVCGGGASVEASMGGTRFNLFPAPPVANDLKMSTLDGKTFALSDLKGKVVLLNFWRSHCPFCAREKQGLKKMLRGMDRKDLECLCVNLWDSPSWVSSRCKDENGPGIVYAMRPAGPSPLVENKVRGRLMGYYVVNDDNEAIYEIKGFPSTYVIDKRGKVVAFHLGMVDWMNRSVRGWLLSLLGRERSMNLARSQQSDDYALPTWIDRLLTNPGLPQVENLARPALIPALKRGSAPGAPR